MPTVRVFNDNEHPFEQRFHGEVIKIPAKGFVEMDLYEASSFISKPSPMMKTGQGYDPRGYKMLRIPQEDLKKAREGEVEKVVAYKSHVDGTIHATQEDLEKHDQKFAHRRVKDKEK